MNKIIKDSLISIYIELKEKINKLQNEKENLELLKEIQDTIIKKLLNLEQYKKISRRKKKREKFKKQIFLIKAFGDAIAYIYLDKHNLKQMSYKIDTFEEKNLPGIISDKDGFDFEYNTLKTIISKGIPCVLCDITNNLRYGDICVLVGPDPYVIECKKSKNKNQRVRRQIEELEKVSKFYKFDKKETNMGLTETRRITINSDEKNYCTIINNMFDEAKKNRISVRRTEKGLYYIIIYGKFKKSFNKIFPTDIKNPFIYFLNQKKNDCDWVSYYPFVLSIKKTQHLIDFIEGKLSINIIVDLDKIKNIASSLGLKYKFEMNSEHPFNFYIIGEENDKNASGMFGISWHFFNRIGLEFISLKWLINTSKKMFINST